MVYCNECYIVSLLHATLFLLETLGGIMSLKFTPLPFSFILFVEASKT
jgi:hypothetical protein